MERFQARFMRRPDGRVGPGGRTLRRILAMVPATSPDWSGVSRQWPREKKPASLDGRTRPKVTRVLKALEAEDFNPKVVFAWRSVEVQAELLRKGRTRVSFGIHNAQTRDGSPRAHAADIIGRGWAWTKPAETRGFWTALGRATRDEGLFWGGSWPTFEDWVHVQDYPGSRLAQVRRERRPA